MTTPRYAVALCGLLSAASAQAAPALLYPMDQAPVTGGKAIRDCATDNTNLWGTLSGGALPAVAGGAAAYTSNAWNFAGASYLKVGPHAGTRALGDTASTPGLSIGLWLKSPGAVWARAAGESGVFELAYDAYRNMTFNFGNNVNIPVISISSSGVAPADGAWHHVLVAFHFQRVTNNLCLYQDGVLKAVQTELPLNAFNATNATLAIGSDGSHAWGGLIDQFAVYTNALQADEVAQLFSAGAVSNYAPVAFVAADAPRLVWPADTVGVSARVSDDGLPASPGAVACAWSKASGPGSVAFADPAATDTAATFSAPGPYVLRLTVNDGELADYSEIAVLVVTNRAPDVAAWSSAATLLSSNSSTVAVSGWVWDDGLPSPPAATNAAWTQVSGPAAVTFADPSRLDTSATIPAAVGTYVLRLTASDSELSCTADVTIRVASNLAPAVSAWAAAPLLQWPSNAVALRAEVGDDGRPGPVACGWSLVSGPGAVTFGDAAATDTTATCSLPGLYRLRLVASDGELSATNDVYVNLWEKSPGVLPPPDMRRLSPTPPPYEHPRVLFTEADRADLQARAAGDAVVWDAVYGASGLTNTVKKTIDNPNTPAGRVYARLAAGDDTVAVQAVVEGAGFYGELTKACYLAWLWPTNAVRLRQLATAVGTAAAIQSRSSGRASGIVELALCYDIVYDWMSEGQRAAARSLIASVAAGKHSYAWGWPDYNRQNWIMEGLNIVLADLAIEGEAGYDAQTTEELRGQMKTYCTRWGIMEQGFNGEGMGYFGFGMGLGGAAASVALSRRGENLYVSTRLFHSMIEAFYMMPPWLNGKLFDHHDGVGWSGSAQSTLYFTLKYMFPNDPMVDVIFRNALVGSAHSGIPFYKAVFGTAPSALYTNCAAAALASGLPLTKCDPQRGFGTARSDWGPGALQLDFDCRFDTFGTGHMHTDRNSFYLWSHGRTWIGDPGYHITENDAHSTVLIDGLGQSGSSPNNLWPSLPARFVEYRNHPDMALYAGDARLPYGYSVAGPDPSTNSALGVATPWRWLDLMVEPPADLSGNNAWMTWNVRALPTPYNPVQRAFRSALLVRGAKPYVLVVDDIQKDAQPHTYAWSANTIGCDGATDMALLSGATATDAVCYHASDTNAPQPRLLVRVLEGTGTAAPIQLTDETLATGNRVKRLVITRADTVAPDFKVLLFPHLSGEALPATAWSNGALTVTLSDGQADRFYFAPHADGRLRITRYRVAGTNAVLTAPGGLAALPGDAQAALGWDAKPGALGYSLARAAASGGPFVPVASNLTCLAFTDTGLVNGATYYYVVSALNANGEGEPSSPVSVTPNVAGHVACGLTWQGDGAANVWDNQNAANPVWRAAGAPVPFFNGDTVTFGDAGSGAPPVWLAQALRPAANVVVDAAQDYTFAGAGRITGSAGWLKRGAGTLLLLTDNDCSGPATISGGLVRSGDGGTNGWLGSGPVVLDGGGLTLDRADANAFSNALSGSGAFTVQGGGNLTLAGDNAAFAGSVAVNAGTLTVSSPSGVGTGSVAVNGSTLASAYAGLANSAGLTLSGGGALRLADSANVTFDRSLALGAGGGTVDHGNTLTLASAATGSGGLLKAGAGTLVLAAANAYAGDTVVAAGLLQVGSGGAAGAVPTNLVLAGGSLLFNRSGAYVQKGVIRTTVSNSLIDNVAGSGSLTLTLADGVNVFNTFYNTSTNGPLILCGSPRSTNVVLTGTGFRNKSAAGTLWLAGGVWTVPSLGNNSGACWQGTNVLSDGGTLVAAAGRGLWGLTVLTNGGLFRVTGDRLNFEYQGAGTRVGFDVQEGGVLDVWGNAYGFNPGSSAANGSGAINQTGGSVLVGVSGAGGNRSLTLGSGTATYRASYSLSGGRLLVAGTLAASAGSSNAFVWSGGTLAVGTFNAANLSSVPANALVNGGGTLAPGDLGVPGKTVITGGYVCSDASALAVDIGGATKASAFTNGPSCYDTVAVSGGAALAGSLRPALLGGYRPAATNSFTVLTAGGPLTGTFDTINAYGRVPLANDSAWSFQVVVTNNSVILTNLSQEWAGLPMQTCVWSRVGGAVSAPENRADTAPPRGGDPNNKHKQHTPPPPATTPHRAGALGGFLLNRLDLSPNTSWTLRGSNLVFVANDGGINPAVIGNGVAVFDCGVVVSNDLTLALPGSSGATFTFNGPILGSGAVTTYRTGAAPGVHVNNAANAFAGTWFCVSNGASLRFASDGAIGAPGSDITLLQGGSLEGSALGNITLGGGRTLTVGAGGGALVGGASGRAYTLTNAAGLAGADLLTVGRYGALVLNASQPGFTGPVTVGCPTPGGGAATLTLGASNALGGARSVTATNWGVVALNHASGAGALTVTNLPNSQTSLGATPSPSGTKLFLSDLAAVAGTDAQLGALAAGVNLAVAGGGAVPLIVHATANGSGLPAGLSPSGLCYGLGVNMTTSAGLTVGDAGGGWRGLGVGVGGAYSLGGAGAVTLNGGAELDALVGGTLTVSTRLTGGGAADALALRGGGTVQFGHAGNSFASRLVGCGAGVAFVQSGAAENPYVFADGANALGALTVGAGAAVTLAGNSAGATNVFSGSLKINAGGALSLTNGTFPFTNTGFGNGGQSGTGALTVNGGACVSLNYTRYLYWSNVTVNGGSLLALGDRFDFGNTARQSLNLNGGSLTLTNGPGNNYGFALGGTVGATATQTGGSLTVYAPGSATSLTVGGNAASKTSSYLLSGGTVFLGSGYSSGSLTIGADTAGTGLGLFSLTGGKLVCAGTVAGQQGAGARQVFDFSGGTLAAAAVDATKLAPPGAPAAQGTFVNAGGVLAPGDLGVAGRTAVTGSFSNAPAATLALDLGGAAQATAFQTGQYDYLTVNNGAAALGGRLDVALLNGYVPASASATFTVLRNSGTGAALSGGFANVSDGRVWCADGSSRFDVRFATATANKDVILSNYAANVWNQASGGAWEAGANWTLAEPGGSDRAAVFGAALASPGRVTLDAVRTVRGLTFANAAASYTVAGPGSLTLLGDALTAPLLRVTAGNHAVSVRIALAQDASVEVAAGCALALDGAVTGGKALAKLGAGTLTLSGDNALGRVAVSGGAVVLSAGTSTFEALSLASGTSFSMLSGSLTLQYGLAVSGSGAFNLQREAAALFLRRGSDGGAADTAGEVLGCIAAGQFKARGLPAKAAAFNVSEVNVEGTWYVKVALRVLGAVLTAQ